MSEIERFCPFPVTYGDVPPDEIDPMQPLVLIGGQAAKILLVLKSDDAVIPGVMSQALIDSLEIVETRHKAIGRLGQHALE